MTDASPAKWHLAHTAWFFETFVLRDHVPGWHLQHPDWAFLFNSYYESEGRRLSRTARGMLSRPCLREILAWRAAVNEGVSRALLAMSPAARQCVQLGRQHEQQHQELLLTDILHAFSTNPLEPALWAPQILTPLTTPRQQGWIKRHDGLCAIGHRADDTASFAFDCEGPRHSVVLSPHVLTDRVLTNEEWAAFTADGGYDQPLLWPSPPPCAGAGRTTVGGAPLALMVGIRLIHPTERPVSLAMCGNGPAAPIALIPVFVLPMVRWANTTVNS